MKRTRTEEDSVMTTEKNTTKKRVHFAEVESEIIPDSTPAREVNNETEWLTDVRKGEEQWIEPEEEGTEFEPFNLNEERERGSFGEDGFYVENRSDKAEEFDAWLASEDSKICSKEVIQNHHKMQVALAAADQSAGPTTDELKQTKEKIVNLLMSRETVLAGLRRVAKKKSTDGSSKESMKDFEELTEAADLLLNSGDTDVYSKRREDFEYDLKTSDDMFADDSDTEEKEAEGGVAEKLQERPAKKLKQESQNSVAASQTDFGSWPVAELKRFLQEKNVNVSGIVEKRELVEKARDVDKKFASYASFQAPEGYVYDSNSGYFYNAKDEMYYDGPSRCFYNPKTTKWYDETGKEIS